MTGYPIVATAVAVAGLLAGCGDTDPVMDDRNPLPQQATERVFAPGEPEIVDTLHVDDPTFHPRDLVVLDGGDLLVSDAGSFQVVRLDRQGNVITRFGEGAGSGPGENRFFGNIGELPSGDIWVHDIMNSLVYVYEPDGPLSTTVSLGSRMHTVSALDGSTIIGVNPIIPDPFRRFDRSGEIVRRWGWFVEEPGPMAMAFIGRILGHPDGSAIIFTTDRAGRIFAYDREGGLLWHRKGIDGHEPPDVSIDDEGGIDFNAQDGIPLLYQRPLNAWGGHFYTVVLRREEDAVMLDRYDLSDGAYEMSVRIPLGQGCGPRYVTGTTAYGICAGVSIVRYRMPTL